MYLMDFKSLIFQWINPLNLREIITSESNQIMARHFSDATLVAEIIQYYWPSIIEIHNYVRTNSKKQKIVNWELLNKKVLEKLDLVLSKDFINKLSNNDVNSICTFLKSLKHVADNHEIEKQLQLEKKKIQPVYTIINDEIIDVTDTDYSKKKVFYIDENVVRLITKQKHEIVAMKRQIEQMRAIIDMKNKRLMEKDTLISKMKRYIDNFTKNLSETCIY